MEFSKSSILLGALLAALLFVLYAPSAEAATCCQICNAYACCDDCDTDLNICSSGSCAAQCDFRSTTNNCGGNCMYGQTGKCCGNNWFAGSDWSCACGTGNGGNVAVRYFTENPVGTLRCDNSGSTNWQDCPDRGNNGFGGLGEPHASGTASCNNLPGGGYFGPSGNTWDTIDYMPSCRQNDYLGICTSNACIENNQGIHSLCWESIEDALNPSLLFEAKICSDSDDAGTALSLSGFVSEGSCSAVRQVSRFGYMYIGNRCVDILEDEDHCGGPNNACANGENVQNHCRGGLCVCADECDYRSGFETRRYGRCHRDIEGVVPESYWRGVLGLDEDMIRHDDVSDVDVWPPLTYDMFNSGEYDIADPDFNMAMDYIGYQSGFGFPYTSEITDNCVYTWATQFGKSDTDWVRFFDEWSTRCPIDFFAARYHCPAVARPSGIVYDNGVTESWRSNNRDHAVNAQCHFNCGGNVGMERSLYQCSRFNPHFRKIVNQYFQTGDDADLNNACMAASNQFDNEDVDVDWPNSDEASLCCAASAECAMYSTVCDEQNSYSTVSSFGPVTSLPCDARSPISPGRWRDRGALCSPDSGLYPIPIGLNQAYPFNHGVDGHSSWTAWTAEPWQPSNDPKELGMPDASVLLDDLYLYINTPADGEYDNIYTTVFVFDPQQLDLSSGTYYVNFRYDGGIYYETTPYDSNDYEFTAGCEYWEAGLQVEVYDAYSDDWCYGSGPGNGGSGPQEGYIDGAEIYDYSFFCVSEVGTVASFTYNSANPKAFYIVVKTDKPVVGFVEVSTGFIPYASDCSSEAFEYCFN